MSLYDIILSTFEPKVEKKEGEGNIMKGKRPLKMPKDYDFSVRNVRWKDYDNEFILRTDAVWEKHKLYDYFYSLYKV